MIEVKISELVKYIGKNGFTTFRTICGNGILEVRPRFEKPLEYDLYFMREGETNLMNDEAPAPYVGIPHLIPEP